jgi:hypothetical protein
MSEEKILEKLDDLVLVQMVESDLTILLKIKMSRIIIQLLLLLQKIIAFWKMVVINRALKSKI